MVGSPPSRPLKFAGQILGARDETPYVTRCIEGVLPRYAPEDVGFETVEDVRLTGWEASSTDSAADEVWALVIAWSAEGLERLGEVALFGGAGPFVLGRGPEGDGVRVTFVRQRPGEQPAASPIEAKGISRDQVRFTPDDGLVATNVGRCKMFVNGEPQDEATLGEGDTLLLHNQLLLVCERRPARLAPLRSLPSDAVPAFGAADRFGIVGESSVIWGLRERAATVANTPEHVLVLGDSGAGKELAARLIHALSREGPFTARNAATIPDALVDAELFGNAKNYPNPGMAERAGLVGEADGGTLMLDEVAELPERSQASLLRVLDGGGEYHRLGDSSQRRSSFRFVGATNRSKEELKHDLLARLTSRILVPGLTDRRADIPLIARHLLAARCRETPAYAERFGGEQLRVAPQLMERLVRHPYTHHVRELSRLVSTALATSPGNFVALTEEVEAELGAPPTPVTRDVEPSAEDIQSALDVAKGSRAKAAKALGLSSRFVLYRLMKRHGLDAD